MLLKLLFITLVFNSILIVAFCQRQNDSCVASAGSIEDCLQIIASNCENATFIANRLAYSDHCSPVSLFWDAPMYNMTILFQNNVTKPYSICIPRVACTEAYRTLDSDQEVPIKWNTSSTDPVCFKTERHDQSIMKFRFDAGDQWRCYGTFIRFSYHF